MMVPGVNGERTQNYPLTIDTVRASASQVCIFMRVKHNLELYNQTP